MAEPEVTKREQRLAQQEALRERWLAGHRLVILKKGKPFDGLKKWVYKLVWPTGYTEERETPWAVKQRRTRTKTRRAAHASRKINQQRAATARRKRQERSARCRRGQ